MRESTRPWPENPCDRLALLRGVLQRIAQAEHAADFAIIRQLLLERIAALEKEIAHTSSAHSKPRYRRFEIERQARKKP